ncbi:MAG TPA: hypothetical protein VKA98_01700 [Nitrososphaeraceae archaeon]|jgi:hypothetical protein|nr:hypothetical protein [Nitrososphaeraceae archaeon]
MEKEEEKILTKHSIGKKGVNLSTRMQFSKVKNNVPSDNAEGKNRRIRK